MNIRAKLSSLDNLLLAIFGFGVIVPAVAEAYGYEPRLLWMPVITYLIWIIVTGYVQPNFLAGDSIERSIAYRIRGWSFLVSLPVLLLYNFGFITFFPVTSDFVYRIIGLAVGQLATVIAVSALVNLVPSKLLRDETSTMEVDQMRTIHLLQSYVGSAAIYASFIIVLVNGQILRSIAVFSESNLTDLEITGLTLAMIVVALIALSQRVRMSSRLVADLAESLVQSRWYNKHIRKRKTRSPHPSRRKATS